MYAIMLPEEILIALDPLVRKLRMPQCGRDWMTGEACYVSITRDNGGSQQTIETFTFRGHKVTRCFPGHRSKTTLIARTQEAYLGAVAAAVSYVDARLQTKPSIHAWLQWLVEGGPVAASEWLEEPTVAMALVHIGDIPIFHDPKKGLRVLTDMEKELLVV